MPQDPRGEQHRLVSAPLLRRRAGEHLLAEPREVRRILRELRVAPAPPAKIVRREHRRPERARTRKDRLAAVVRGEVGEEKRGIAPRTPQRAFIHPPAWRRTLEHDAEA